MAGFNSNVLIGALASAASSALKSANASPTIMADITPRAQETIASAIIEKFEDSPEVQHLTSTEAWYQSRANWSAIITAVTPMAAIAGYNLSPENQTFVAVGLTLAGNAVGAYLARRARTATKPLGA